MIYQVLKDRSTNVKDSTLTLEEVNEKLDALIEGEER